MFHQVRNLNKFFKDLHKMIKKNGRLYLEDGHQPRKINLCFSKYLNKRP